MASLRNARTGSLLPQTSCHQCIRWIIQPALYNPANHPVEKTADPVENAVFLTVSIIFLVRKMALLTRTVALLTISIIFLVRKTAGLPQFVDRLAPKNGQPATTGSSLSGSAIARGDDLPCRAPLDSGRPDGAARRPCLSNRGCAAVNPVCRIPFQPRPRPFWRAAGPAVCGAKMPGKK